MIWIPVAFVCLMNDTCSFYHGGISVSIEQCNMANAKATVVMQRDPDVKAYKVDCLEIKPKETDSL